MKMDFLLLLRERKGEFITVLSVFWSRVLLKVAQIDIRRFSLQSLEGLIPYAAKEKSDRKLNISTS